MTTEIAVRVREYKTQQVFILKTAELWILTSNLFHSNIFEGK